MNIDTDNTYTIYKKEFENRVLYSTRINRKLKDGSYDNAFITVQFKKGIEVENKTKICIKKGWLTFYKTREQNAIFYIFIDEFNIVNDNEFENASVKTKTSAIDSLGIVIEPSDLPF